MSLWPPRREDWAKLDVRSRAQVPKGGQAAQILSGRGLPTLGASGIADVLWRNLAVAALLGPLGVCVGALVRNQIVTVVGLVIMAAALEPPSSRRSRKSVASSRSPALRAASSAAPTGRCRPAPHSRSCVAWTLTVFAAAAWRLRGRDLV